MSDIDLVLQGLGFVADNESVLHAPESSRVTLAPIGQFYELRIHSPDGNAIVAVISKSAVKISREASSKTVDVDALLNVEQRGPWTKL